MENFALISATSTTVTLSWDVVPEDIDGYVITYTSNDDDDSITSIKGIRRITSELTVSDLKPGRTYTFKIYTVKDSDAGPESSVTGETG